MNDRLYFKYLNKEILISILQHFIFYKKILDRESYLKLNMMFEKLIIARVFINVFWNILQVVLIL